MSRNPKHIKHNSKCIKRKSKCIKRKSKNNSNSKNMIKLTDIMIYPKKDQIKYLSKIDITSVKSWIKKQEEYLNKNEPNTQYIFNPYRKKMLEIQQEISKMMKEIQWNDSIEWREKQPTKKQYEMIHKLLSESISKMNRGELNNLIQAKLGERIYYALNYDLKQNQDLKWKEDLK